MIEIKVNNVIFQKRSKGVWDTFVPTKDHPRMLRERTGKTFRGAPYAHHPEDLMPIAFHGKKDFVDHLQAFLPHAENIHYVGSRDDIPACPENAMEGYGIYLHECTIVTHFFAGVKDRKVHTWQEHYVIAERFRTDLDVEPETIAESEPVVTWARRRYFIADGEIVPSKTMLHANGTYKDVSEPFRLRRDAETVLKGEAA